MRADADAVAHRVGDFAWAEFLVAGASVVCLSISLVKGEPGWKIVPVAVLIAYVLFASIQV